MHWPRDLRSWKGQTQLNQQHLHRLYHVLRIMMAPQPLRHLHMRLSSMQLGHLLRESSMQRLYLMSQVPRNSKTESAEYHKVFIRKFTLNAILQGQRVTPVKRESILKMSYNAIQLFLTTGGLPSKWRVGLLVSSLTRACIAKKTSLAKGWRLRITWHVPISHQNFCT